MENKKQENTIYKIFCICICLLIWLLSYFDGHIYLSSNGYAILKENLLNPIGIDEKGRAEQSIIHEMTINGGHFYLMYTGGEEYIYRQVPENGLRFSGQWFRKDKSAFIEFYISEKEDGTFHYEPVDEISYIGPTSQVECMIRDFIAVQWHNFNIFGYARMEGGHPLQMFFAFVLVLLLRFQCLQLVKKWEGIEKNKKIYQRITYGGFVILQFIVLIIAILQFTTFIY